MAFPPKSQREQVMVLVCLMGAAIGAAYWNYVYKPKVAEMATVTMRLDSLEVHNRAAKKEAAKGTADQLKAEAERAQRDLDVMRQLVPTGNEVPALLEQVSTAARRAGLDISAVQPEAVIAGPQFDTYRYKLSVTGDYHAIGEFLSNVGSLTRIMAPVNLALSVSNNSSTDAMQRRSPGNSALDTKFIVQTYVAKTSTVARGGNAQ